MNLTQFLSYGRALLGIAHGNRAFGGPPQVRISLTNRCNLRCIHCYFYSPLASMPLMREVRRSRMCNRNAPERQELARIQKLDMDVDRIYPILREILSLGTRRFEFTGNGEPFVHPRALELMAFLKNAGCHCQVNTNGTLLKRTTIDQLIDVGFDELRITTMAGSPQIYNKTHPGAPPHTFEVLKDRLQYASKRKARLGRRRPLITLVMIVIRQNIDDLINFAKFATEVNAQNVLFRPVDDIEDDGLAKLVPDGQMAQKTENRLISIKGELDLIGIRHNIGYFLRVFRKQLDTRALYRSIPCYYAWLDPEIDPIGNVYACCRCYKIMGNVYDHGFATVWKSRDFRRLRHTAKHICETGIFPETCDCNSCVNHTANLRIFEYLHPIKGRRLPIEPWLGSNGGENLKDRSV